MALETKEEAARYLWSLCLGFDGDGWQRWRNGEHNTRLIEIRRILRRQDEETFGRHCNGLNFNDHNSHCKQQVAVDQLSCRYHTYHVTEMDLSEE